MDLNSIAVFVKVVQAGSFSEAARRLRMPKTTVSARVAGLESSLGVNLIQRTTRKLNVTEAGRRYFDHCVEALQRLQEGEAELASASDHPQGTLRITAPVDLGQTLLPKIIHAFLRRYPAVNVEMRIMNRLVDLVGEGIDLAIRAGAMKDSSLVSKRFFDLTGNFWSTPSYLDEVARPKQPKDLSRLKFIAFGSLNSIRLSKGKTVTDVPLPGRIRCDDLAASKAMILLGDCIGWLPDFLAEDEAVAGRLVPVLPGWSANVEDAVCFLYPGLKRGSANVRAFIETALVSLGQPASRAESVHTASHTS